MKIQKGFGALLVALLISITNTTYGAGPVDISPYIISVVPDFTLNLQSNKGVDAAFILTDDLNGDKRPDLIVFPKSGQAHYYLNNKTNDAFKDVEPYFFGELLAFRDGVLIDINNDGLKDIVVGVYGGINKIFINNGSKEQPFSAVNTLDIGSDADNTTGIVVGHLDDDEYLDVVVGNTSAQYNKWYLNNGTNNPFDNVAGQNVIDDKVDSDRHNTNDIELGDYDGDGYLDLFVVNSDVLGGKQVVIYLNNTTEAPFLSVPSLLFKEAKDAKNIVVDDLDGDGDLDFVVGTGVKDNTYYVYRNNKATHSNATYYYDYTYIDIAKPFDSDVNITQLSDINQDGKLDLLAVFNDPNEQNKTAAQVLLNDGNEYPFESSAPIHIDRKHLTVESAFSISELDTNIGVELIAIGSNGIFQYQNELVSDTTPPVIELRDIANNSVLLKPSFLEVRVIAKDYVGIDNTTFSMSYADADGNFIPYQWDNGWDGVLEGPYTGADLTNISATDHKIEVTAIDKRGNESSKVYHFSLVTDASLLDTDGDGMLDQWEDLNGFDKLNPADAAQDKDEDGLSNVEEFQHKTDPSKADSDSDGYSDSEEIVNGTNPQTLDIRPRLDFPIDRLVGEGSEVILDVFLSRDAPVYPIIVEVIVESTSTAQQGADFKLSTQTLTINEGRKGSLILTVLDDGLAEGREVLTLSLASNEHAILGVQNKINITIVEENITPVTELHVKQGERVSRIVASSQGLVSIIADVSDINGKDVHAITWDFADELGVTQIDASTLSASFDPVAVEAGVYTVEVTVTDNGSPQLSTTTKIDVKVVTEDKPASELLDDNDNGIANAFDRATEKHQLQARAGAGTEGLISTLPGLKLSIGSTALSGDAKNAEVDTAEISRFMAAKTTHNTVDEITNIGGYFDFDVSGLPFPGMTVDIVIPLRGDVPRNAVYRKFNPLNGWNNFVEDASNQVSSARRGVDGCPSAGSDLYTAGLTPFTQCVQLSIEDGGPNDMDGTANGVIRDPGGIAIQPEAVEEEEVEEESENTSSGGSGGGGSADSFLLMLLVFGALWRRRILVRR